MALLLAGTLLLSGCLFPTFKLPGYQEGSRQNISRQTTGFIEPFKTTRQDVVLELGEPDGIAADGSWISYGSAYTRGGFGLGIVLSSALGGDMEQVKREYRQLVIFFDGNGVVTSLSFTEQLCTGAESIGSTMRPCAPPVPVAIAASEIAAQLKAEGTVTTFEPAVWHPGCGDEQGWGRLFITEHSLFFQADDSALDKEATIVRIPFADLTAVSGHSSLIRLDHGERDCVGIPKGPRHWWGYRNDKVRTTVLRELLETKLRARVPPRNARPE